MKLIYLAFLFSSLFSYGQSKLTGKITDAQHEPIEFGNRKLPSKRKEFSNEEERNRTD